MPIIWWTTAPCAFDRIDRLVMDELSQDDTLVDYDPEAAL